MGGPDLLNHLLKLLKSFKLKRLGISVLFNCRFRDFHDDMRKIDAYQSLKLKVNLAEGFPDTAITMSKISSIGV